MGFGGQTKSRLGNTEVEGIVTSLVNEKLEQFLEELGHLPTAAPDHRGGNIRTAAELMLNDLEHAVLQAIDPAGIPSANRRLLGTIPEQQRHPDRAPCR